MYYNLKGIIGNKGRSQTKTEIHPIFPTKTEHTEDTHISTQQYVPSSNLDKQQKKRNKQNLLYTKLNNHLHLASQITR